MNNPKNQKKKNNPQASKNPVQKKNSPQKKGFSDWLWLSAILLLTFIVFIPALNNALTNWDDPVLILDNPLIRNLNAASIKRIFTEVYSANSGYMPLHIFSYLIEYHFFGASPHGYHWVSVIMHLVATGLVCWFIFSLTKNSTIALITTLLFGIHPLHVESVAWAAERKDLIYTIFFLASLIFYIEYIRTSEKLKYLFFAFLLFALSILSKSMAASLPPVLILLDIYFGRKVNAKMILEKIPFFALAVILGIISVKTASSTGSISLHVFTFVERVLIANFNLIAYTVKLIVPIKLSAYYPYPARVDGSLAYYFYIAPFVIIGLAFLVIRSLKKTKVIFFGAGFFLLCILLVLQFFPVGPTIISERYAYLPSIGFFFIISWWIKERLDKRPALKTTLFAGLAGYSLFLSVTTFQRCDVWKDSFTLWSDVLDQFPHTGMALNNRGNILGKERGQLDLALEEFNKSILYDPEFENAYVNRGIVYSMKGKFDLAFKDFDKAIQLNPNYFDAYFNRGISYLNTNQVEKALEDFTTLLKYKKENPGLYLNLGFSYMRLGKNEQALENFNTSLSMNPNYAEAYYGRSNVLFNLHRYKEALDDVQSAMNLGYNVEPNYLQTIKQAAGAK